MASLGLAAPKRKVKYNIDERNNAWANDENKFGQKLLEKFGWAQGKGLGANEDGKRDNIKVKVKNDKLGVGSVLDYSDTWLDHQDDFNAVLARLASSHSAPNSGAASPTRQSDDVSSMEERSKTSKARVHYKKFTRSKDLKRANAEDLDALFGVRRNYEKRTKKKKTVAQSAPVTPAGGRSPEPQEKETGDDSSVDKEYDADGNLRTVTSTLSVADYFAQKMAALKAQRVLGSAATTFCDNAAAKGSAVTTEFDNAAVIAAEDSAVATDDRVNDVCRDADEASKEDEEEDKPEVYAQEKFQKSGISVQEYFRLKMEEKKAKAVAKRGFKEGGNEEKEEEAGNGSVSMVDEGVEQQGGIDKIGKKKKKKREKKKVKEETIDEETNDDVRLIKDKKIKKKKKKTGNKETEEDHQNATVSIESEPTTTNEDENKKKKKKKKKRDEGESEEDRATSLDATSEEQCVETTTAETKKKKKKRKAGTETESGIEDHLQGERGEQPPSKKKKKMKPELCLDEPPLPNVGQKKKKKKKVHSD